MKSFFTPLCLLLSCAALLAGCGGPNTTTVGLKVELTGIAQHAGGGTEVTWRVVNPNIVPYLLARANQRVYLDGVLVGTVDDREALAIPAQSNQERTNVLVPAAGGASALSAAAARGSATYRLESAVTIRLFGDTTEKTDLRNAGTVPVAAK